MKCFRNFLKKCPYPDNEDGLKCEVCNYEPISLICEKRKLVIFRVHENSTVDLVSDDANKNDLAAIAFHFGVETMSADGWFKEVCSKCGWHSKPHRGMAFGPGGTLSCPACEKANRNPSLLEMSYGSVHSVRVMRFNSEKINREVENK